MMNVTCRNKKTIQKIIKSPSTTTDNNRCKTVVDPFSSKYQLDDSTNSTLDEPVDPELVNLLHVRSVILSLHSVF